MVNSKSNVLGVSGVFIYSPNPKALSKWYEKVFGFNFNYWAENKSYGLEFVHDNANLRHSVGVPSTVMAIHPNNKKLGKGGGGNVKVQYRVDDIPRFVKELNALNVAVEKVKKYSYGIFAWIKDPDGNQIELYQPF